MKGHMTPNAALKLAHSREGNFAAIFALTLPALVAFVTFIGDQANMLHVQSRVREARDAANIAVALESVQGNKTRAQLEAYARDFFLANLGEDYAEASSLKLTMPKWPSVGGVRLEAHVRYEPIFAPVYAAASGQPGSEFAVDIH
jgi:Flp pilus assembly protein TadG